MKYQYQNVALSLVIIALCVTVSVGANVVTAHHTTIEPQTTKHSIGKGRREKDTLPSSIGELERRIENLLRDAERAQLDAKWHEEWARIWEDIAATQKALGDLCSACDPLAEFNAQTHRNQIERKQARARRLRQEADRLRQERNCI